ncbi:N-acetyltransferase [Limibaculum sp. FT325]|uniref:GNAT family N-acetyltransferase n=1 Tax=Thermohalobaculum sediminis TaxID=2939436 RepID=UPI0020C03414|nr:GNAT family N-acetyltransferase [Limibaculum sediminis]MCL5776215.1 N-acetyltransferase [Limibaculum sediminis]
MTATIETLGPDGLAEVLGWAAEEGWNPGLGDAAAFHAADPEGFFLRRVGGVPAAAISVVNHAPGSAFLGLYICRPEFRGQGHGIATWTAALEHAGARTVGLDGVPAQQANYRRSGFVAAGSSLRHEGTAAPDPLPGVRPAIPPDLPHLARLDRAANGIDRPRFLAAWLAARDGRETLVLERDGAITGFATLRACGRGTKIGPLVAPGTGAALGLVGAAARRAGAGPLVIDLPEANLALRRELEAMGWTVPFTTARMYRGPAPEAGPGLQAIATMELG